MDKACVNSDSKFVVPNYSLDLNLGPSKLRFTIPIQGIRSSTVLEFRNKFIPKIYKKPSNGDILFGIKEDGFLFEFRGTSLFKGENYRLKVSKLPVTLDPRKSNYTVRDDAVELLLVRSDGGSFDSIMKEWFLMDLTAET